MSRPPVIFIVLITVRKLILLRRLYITAGVRVLFTQLLLCRYVMLPPTPISVYFLILLCCILDTSGACDLTTQKLVHIHIMLTIKSAVGNGERNYGGWG